MNRRWTGLLAILLFAPVFVCAQGTADGSVPPADQKPPEATTPVDPAPADTASNPANTGSASQGTPAPSGTQAPTATSTSAPSAGTTSRPTTPTPGSSVPATTPEPVQAAGLPSDSSASDSIANEATPGTNPWLWPAVGAAVFVLALIPFGFLIAGWMKKKPKPKAEAEGDNSQNRCFDIKQLMEEKLKELTDVKAVLAEQAKEKAKEAVRDAVSGTATGDLLVKAEKLEEQYKKLRALFEECQIDIDNYAYKGVLLESSQMDKRILKNLRIIRTRNEDNQILHDIRVSKAQINDLQNNFVDQKWYFHLWKPGTDDVTVVFKDKIFEIKYSDPKTWEDAIVHGVMSGIPREKLDFAIVK